MQMCYRCIHQTLLLLFCWHHCLESSWASEYNATPGGVFLPKHISLSSLFLTVTCVGCSGNKSKMEDVFKAILPCGMFCLLLAASSLRSFLSGVSCVVWWSVMDFTLRNFLSSLFEPTYIFGHYHILYNSDSQLCFLCKINTLIYFRPVDW